MRDEKTEVTAPELMRWLPVATVVLVGLVLYLWVLLAGPGTTPGDLVGR